MDEAKTTLFRVWADIEITHQLLAAVIEERGQAGAPMTPNTAAWYIVQGQLAPLNFTNIQCSPIKETT